MPRGSREINIQQAMYYIEIRAKLEERIRRVGIIL